MLKVPEPPPVNYRGENNPLATGVHNLGDLLLVIRDRWLLAALIAGIAAGVFAWFRLQEEPMYQAKTRLFFESSTDRVINVERVRDPAGFGEGRFEEHMIEITSGRFLGRVVDTFTEEERQSLLRPYTEPGEEPPAIWGVISRGINIRRSGGSIFEVTYRHRDPSMTSLVANRYADEYIQFNLDQAGRSNENAIRFLEAQKEELAQAVASGEIALQRYRQENDVLSLKESQNLVGQRLQSLHNAVTNANIELLNISALINQVEQTQTDGGDLTEIPSIANYGEVSGVLSSIKRLEANRTLLSRKYLERHPQMIQNATQLDNEKAILSRLVQEAFASLRSRKQEAEVRLTQLRSDLVQAEEDALELDRKAVEYNVIQRKLSSDQMTFGQVLNRLNETILASQLDQTAIRVIDYASPPGGPFSPNRERIYLLSAIIFGGLFLCVPIGIEFLENKVKTRWDIEHFLQKELLGIVPRIRIIEKEKLARLVLEDLDERMVETFTAIFSHIQLSSQVDPPKTIMVTSALPEEGKSTMAANIAATFARNNLRTVLVDLDLRRPAVHRNFQVDNRRGVLAWLKEGGVCPDDGLLRAVPSLGTQEVGDNFDIIPSGGSTKRPTTVFSDARFVKMLQRLKQEYDMIFLDLPPGMVFSDPIIMAEHADETLYVCRHNMVNRHKARRFVQQLEQTGTPVVGIVFNGASMSNSARYGNYDYHAYDRYTMDTEPEEAVREKDTVKS